MFQGSAQHLRVGRDGEDAAARFLRRLGYDIRGRNVRMGRDELDIVAFDPRDGVLVYCEVKSRRRDCDAYSPALAFTIAKKRSMLRGARAHSAACGWEGGYRLDLVLCVGGNVVSHIEDVFQPAFPIDAL